jgi:hypothetical protein
VPREGHNNPPDVVLELSSKEAEFLMRNVDSNIEMGLNLLNGPISKGGAEHIVDLLENFKAVRAKLQKGLAA